MRGHDSAPRINAGPGCGTEALGADGEAAVRCPNADCPAQVRRRLEHFVSKAGVDIHGPGPAWMELLVAGEGAGEKLAEARRLGVVVLDEAGLRALLNEDPAP